MRREQPGQSLQATMLVHDAYLRLVNQEERSWRNRSHFFAVAAHLMRQILIDYARARNAAKRGRGRARLPLEDVIVVSDDKLEEVVAVDDLLQKLAEKDPRLAQIVELRFFGGLTEEEIGGALGISARTVKRDWQVARAWMHGEVSRVDHDAGAMGTS
jgi:RNA polymerase sigma factor (TIGR02999 family)